MGIFENGQNLLGNIKSSAIAETVRKVAPFVIAGTIGYSAADLTVLSLRPSMLPSQAPPVRPRANTLARKSPLTEYNTVTRRNIFNADGKIPPALSQDKQNEEPSSDEAVPSQLPLTLQGTIVHFNPAKSIATIRLNSKNTTQSFVPEEEIEGMARIVSVSRRKVIFINLSNRRTEFIEIPEKDVYDFSMQAKDEPKPDGPVQAVGNNNFSIKRSEVDRLTSNISQVLQQARMEPRFGPDNAVEAFCFVSIQGSSIYESLGLRVGDCITSVNGEPIDSPQKAMEVYQNLRTSNNIKLGLDRDGRDQTFNYDIN